MSKQFFVYLLCSKRNGTFYVGVTSDLPKRVWEHKRGVIDGFTKKYGVKTLVYYEVFDDAESAIRREKRLKRWTRASKIRAIESMNPGWNDLYSVICTS
ncbi:MAG: GIY-YIG nuclease family protein [Alphaproteobacteria bacterium]|nr:GIY-YIG nuclease family protein [Alphaproteobacteria bacterium]